MYLNFVVFVVLYCFVKVGILQNIIVMFVENLIDMLLVFNF